MTTSASADISTSRSAWRRSECRSLNASRRIISTICGVARERPAAIIRRVSEALVIVDFQRDFTPPDGALAVPHGDEIAERLNELAHDPRFDIVIATRDWHPPDHASFAEHGGPWPVHCVQGTPGAELHPALDRVALDAVIDKGQRRDTDGYSAFDAPELEAILR